MLPDTHKHMNLFTYGTLMDLEVWDRVAQERCQSRHAVLRDYEARQLRGEVFPGLVECPGGSAPGLVYRNVSAAALERLDEYEGDIYTRIEVSVDLEDGSPLPAQVYLIQPHCGDLILDEVWHAPVVRASAHT